MQQSILPFQHVTHYMAEDFVVSEANEQAFTLIDQWPDWSHHALFLHGPVGSGKTHLAHLWQSHSEAMMIAADCLTSFIDSGSIAKHVVVEDIDQLGDENALQYLFNWLRDHQGSLLMTSLKPAAQLSLSLADLSSRLQACPSVNITEPDSHLLQSVFLKQCADRQLGLSPEVVAFILKHSDRSFAAVTKLVTELDHYMLTYQRKVTIPLVKAYFADSALASI